MAVERSSPSRVVGSPLGLPPSRLHRVTDALVGFYAAHYGRGPTKAKSFLMEDTIVCVMQEAFVDIERVFMRHGNPELVRQMRADFHGAMRRELEDLVAEASGCSVEASAVEVSFEPEAVTATFTVAR